MSYNEWLDIDVLEDYLDGKLDAKTMHKVEKLSLEDPFVAEALAGLGQSPKRTQTLSLLQKQLQERIAQKPLEVKRWRITSQRLSIAAAAAVLFVTVSILFWMKENKRQQLMAEQNKKIEVSIAPQIAKEVPVAKPTTPPAIIEKVPVLPVQGYINQPAKAKGMKAIVDRFPKLVTETPIASNQAKADSIVVTLASVSAKEAERKKEDRVAVAAQEQKAIAALKKAEAVRERPLPGKVEGIYVETNSNLRTQAAIINGRVYAKTDGQPLPGAIVKVAGTNKATTTNNKGEFSLPVDSTSQSLSVAYIGFTSQEVKAPANGEVNVALEVTKSELNEVLIATGDDQKNQSATQSLNSKVAGVSPNVSPVGGWQRFDEYLKANNKLFKEGAVQKYVTLSFEVKKDGRTKNVKIINGLGKAENDEAIRLVKEGPNWILQKNTNRTASISIKF